MIANRVQRVASDAAGADAQETVGLDAVWEAIRNSLMRAIVVSVFAAIALGGLIAVYRLVEPATQTFNHAIELVFLNAADSKYPNDTPFSLSDIVAPNILSKVYDYNGLSDRNIKLNEFMSSISIAPYSPTLAETIDRYRDRLSDRKLTFAEKTAIEDEMRREIAQLSRHNALLTFISQKPIPLSRAQGSKILSDIVSEWARDAIERRGVLTTPESHDKSALIDATLVGSLDYNLAVELVQNAVKRLLRRIEEIKAYPGATTLIDKASGLNVLSLERELSAVDDFVVAQIGAQIDQFGVSRDKEFSSVVLEARIGQLERAKAKSEQERLAVLQLRESYKNGSSAEAGAARAGGVTTGQGRPETIPSGTVIPQLSGDFIDRLLTLRDNRTDAEFLQKLANEELELRRKTITIGDEIVRLKGAKQAMAQNSPEAVMVEQRLKRDLDAAVARLNSFWEIAGGLFEEINKAKFSVSSSLYRDLALPSSVRVRHPVERTLTIGVIVAVMFLVAAITVAISILVELSKSRAKTE